MYIHNIWAWLNTPTEQLWSIETRMLASDAIYTTLTNFLKFEKFLLNRPGSINSHSLSFFFPGAALHMTQISMQKHWLLLYIELQCSISLKIAILHAAVARNLFGASFLDSCAPHEILHRFIPKTPISKNCYEWSVSRSHYYVSGYHVVCVLLMNLASYFIVKTLVINNGLVNMTMLQLHLQLAYLTRDSVPNMIISTKFKDIRMAIFGWWGMPHSS